jgi:alpha-L-rhamnosidase
LSDDVQDAAPRFNGPALLDGPVRIEHTTPKNGAIVFVGTSRPRLSWKYLTAPSSFVQDAVEINLTRADGHTEIVTIDGPDQVLVEWPFAPLRSREQAHVVMRGRCGSALTPWSERSTIEAALLEPEDWVANWITPVGEFAREGAAPIIGTTFTVDPGLVAARLYITSLGIMIPRINGERISDDHFAPGWTSYEKLLRYRAWDVAATLHVGGNTLDSIIGNGWYRGRIASLSLHRGQAYGDRLGLLVQLELLYDDGRTQCVQSDEGWMAAASRHIHNDFYDGQTVDLRRTDTPPLTLPVEILAAEVGGLELATAPPVRQLEQIHPASVSVRPDGVTIVDFGMNVVGWLRLDVSGSTGQEVTIRHAEVMENGELSVRPLRSAKATDRFILAGGNPETIEPNLTFHGFRFAEIRTEAAIVPGTIVAVVIGSDLERTGWFHSSDASLNQLHANVVRSMQGNFLDIPTDCPQRDERLGWTGDIQVFTPTASALFDVNGFLESWLRNLAVDQQDDGTVPTVVPRVFPEERPIAGWGDAAVIVPWVLYERFGDVGILERQFESMAAWVRRVAVAAGDENLWLGGDQLGDWLDPLAPPNAPSEAQADPDVVATAYFAHSADLVARSAAVLGRSADSTYFRILANDVRAAFNARFVTDDGRVISDCQTVYALALRWDLVADAKVRARAANRLAELVSAQGYRIATGFLGTPVVLDALVDTGHLDQAFAMLLNRDFPSWLYAVDLGATTIWERWDSLLADSSVNPGEMTSFNHYALGAVADWMHRNIGGLAPIDAGYRRVSIAPPLTERISSGSHTHDSPYGRISVFWERDLAGFRLDVELPVGVTADVALPNGIATELTEHGRFHFEFAPHDSSV